MGQDRLYSTLTLAHGCAVGGQNIVKAWINNLKNLTNGGSVTLCRVIVAGLVWIHISLQRDRSLLINKKLLLSDHLYPAPNQFHPEGSCLLCLLWGQLSSPGWQCPIQRTLNDLVRMKMMWFMYRTMVFTLKVTIYQLNTCGRFQTAVLDSLLYHHHQNTKWRNIFLKNGLTSLQFCFPLFLVFPLFVSGRGYPTHLTWSTLLPSWRHQLTFSSSARHPAVLKVQFFSHLSPDRSVHLRASDVKGELRSI